MTADKRMGAVGRVANPSHGRGEAADGGRSKLRGLRMTRANHEGWLFVSRVTGLTRSSA